MSEEMNWNYSRNEQTFELPPEGDYRIRIKSAEKVTASTGNDMISFQFEVSGSSAIIYHNIVFLKDRPEITNRSLTKFFDSFTGIQEGKFNLSTWVGQVGAAHVKHDEYNGKEKLAIHYFISGKQKDSLPAWQEPSSSNNSSSGSSSNPYLGNDGNFVDVANDNDLPF